MSNTNGNQAVTPRLFTPPQAAVYLGVSVSRIWQYIRFRKLHPVALPHPWKEAKDARKTLIDVRELDSFIDQYSMQEETTEESSTYKCKRQLAVNK